MNWKQVTIKQFRDILKVEEQKLDDIDNTSEIIKILFGIEDPLSMPFNEFQHYMDEMKFLSTKVDTNRLANSYILNGTKYIFHGNTFTLTAGQFFDWRQYTKKNPIDYAECLSVFLIPENHKYNDGYDMEKAIDDISCLPMADAIPIFNFFVDGLQMSSQVLTDYLKKQLTEMKSLEPEQKKTILTLIEKYQQAADQAMMYSRTI